jgi:dTMP kinase
MTKSKRGEKRDDNSVQVALGELMGIEEERQTAEREEAQKRAAEEVRRREAEEARRAAEEEVRRAAADERRRTEERAREEEAWTRQREAADREARIRAEAEVNVRAEEMRRVYEFELQTKRIEGGRRRVPPWLAPSVTVLSLGGVGLFAALYLSVQAGAEERLAEAERARTSLRIELEREIDAARAENLSAVTQLADTTRRFEDAQRRLSEQCNGIPVMSRPTKPRAGVPSRPTAVESVNGEDLKGVTEWAPYVPDESSDTIQLGKESKKGKGKKNP